MVGDLDGALSAAGISVADIDLAKVDAWQRVRTEDKPNRRNGAVKVFHADPLRLWFKNHATGVEGSWCDTADDETALESISIPSTVRPVVHDNTYADAARIAQGNFNVADPADPNHPYLVTKQVQPHGIRQLGMALVVPMYGAGGIWSYQTIQPDGTKRYLRGGMKRGCYYPIGSKPESVLIFAEGFATAASVAESVGLPTVVCFDSGNLKPVSEALRGRYRDAQFIFAADNDDRGPKFINAGVAAATSAAKATRGMVIYPQFDDPDLSDWNDAYVLHGADAVRGLFNEVFAWM